MRILAIVIVLLASFLGARNATAEETPYKLLNPLWLVKDGVLTFYFNPEGIWEWYEKNNPLVLAQTTVEARREVQIQLFEKLLRNEAREFNKTTSSLVVTYGGRTTLVCDGLEGVHVVCWKGAEHPWGHEAAKALLKGDLVGEFLFDSAIFIKATYSEKTIFSQYYFERNVVHELSHVIGFDHNAEENSVLGVKFPAGGKLGPVDIMGIEALYPFSSDCASFVETQNGEASINLPYVWVGDEMYTTRFVYDSQKDKLVLTEAEMYAEPPVTSCDLKFDEETGTLKIPYIWYWPPGTPVKQLFSLTIKHMGNYVFDFTATPL